jgi:predicted RNase H-like HicB family nuclease
MRSQYSYPARIERDEEGRYQVRFADLPDALTDGADPAEAFAEAVDCLSAAIASRIIDGEEIPKPSPVAPGQHLISPDPTIALKAALYMQLRQRDMTVADLADRVGVADWHQAARLIDPRRSSKLTSLAAALGALGCRIAISVEGPAEPAPTADEGRTFENPEQLDTEHGGQAPTVSLSDATLRAVQVHGEGATTQDVRDYLSREFGMTVKPHHLGIALQRHRRAGRLENRDERWFSPARADAPARSGRARDQ